MPSFIGKYRAIVMDNKDPEHRGRIKCKCPQVLGAEVLNWALPCLPYGGNKNTGFFSIPQEGSSVWIEFEQGDANRPVWVGVWWAVPEGENDVPSETYLKEKASGGSVWDEAETGEEIRESPDNHVWQTATGHRIELDETECQHKIKITDNKGQHILIRSQDEGEKIYLKDFAGNRVCLDSTNGKKRIVMQDAAGSVLMMDAEKGDINIAAVNDMALMAGGNMYISCKENRDETVGGTHKLSVTSDADWDAGGSVRIAASSGDVNIASGSKAAARSDDPLMGNTELAGGSSPHTHGLSSGKIGQGSSKVKIG